MVPIICFVGWSGSGKTTLMEQVVGELKRKGLRIAVVKHAHRGFDIDRPGKDSCRYRAAGADIVIVASQTQLVTIQRTEEAVDLDSVAVMMNGKVDLVLVEGFKHSSQPKIEVNLSSNNPEISCSTSELLAVVSDRPLNVDIPQFRFNDKDDLVSFVLEQSKVALGGRS